MKACVFVGPTLRPEDLAAAGDIALLPPVAQGDVYRVAQERPSAIGIVDGYFEGVLSVWHKEILWAMAEGIHVFGSASMGALRAAELHPFGMRGIGRIFAAYRDGELEDDDEVAVIHGPRETGYLALSEAMVNVRETLAGAEHCGIIAGATRAVLVGIAKELFYQDRTFDRILELGAEGSVPSGEIAALRAWLPQGRVDQKRADALAMLEAMRALLARAPGPMQVDFVLEWTEVWDEATTAAAASRQPGDGSAAWLPDDRVLEELRLEAVTYLAVRDLALLRVLAGREAERRRQTADAGARQETLTRLRARHGLFTRADLDRWLEANAIDRRRLERIVDEEVQLEAVRGLAAAALRDHLLDELRLRNEFARFAERARSKQALLQGLGLDHPSADAPQLAPPAALRAWYFEQRLGQPVPDDVDAAARELGFTDRIDFDRAVRREWLYLRRAEGSI